MFSNLLSGLGIDAAINMLNLKRLLGNSNQAGGAQGNDNIEANSLGGGDERMYLALEALFGQFDSSDLQVALTSEEIQLFGFFLAALTQAEAAVVMSGISKRESDIRIKDPKILQKRRRTKQGGEEITNETAFTEYSIKTNARGRSIIRGIARHINTEARNNPEKAIAVINDLVGLLRQSKLTRNAEDSTKQALAEGNALGRRVETSVHEALAGIIGGRAVLSLPDVRAAREAIERCTDPKQQVVLSEVYQAILLATVRELKVKENQEQNRRREERLDAMTQGSAKAFRFILDKVTRKDFWIFVGIPLFILGGLIYIGMA